MRCACSPVSSAVAAPDEEQLGKSAGYPIGTRANWFFDERVRVGSFSNLDKLYPHNRLAKAVSPLPLPKAASEVNFRYKFENRTLSVDDFLERQRVTGLLIVKDGEILLERYQYDRLPTHRFLSHSMAKSLVCLAIGLALAEGKIASLDDKVSKYVPELAGYPYGETSIRNILRMASGVKFKEVYDGKDDIARFVQHPRQQGRLRGPAGLYRARGSGRHALPLCVERNRGARPGGQRGDGEDAVRVPHGAAVAADGGRGRRHLDQGHQRPRGAGWEISMRCCATTAASACCSPMTAPSAAKQILPRSFLLEATDWRKQPAAFAPGQATPYFGYGYQFWLFPGAKRRFALLGVYGQSIFVDPELKLVMAITAVAKNGQCRQGAARPRA